MHIGRSVLMTLFISLVVLNSHYAESEGLHNLETSIIDAKNVGKADGGLVEKVQNNNSIDSTNKDMVFGLNETGNKMQKKETDSFSVKAEDSTEKAKDRENGLLEQGTMEPERKIGLRGEECDSSSYSCVIEDKALVACLRVPGNESPDLSLLIQNKGKGMATVIISAPEFVHVETNKIEVLENENKKMKISIGNKGTNTVMVLKSSNGNCSLDFRDLISQETVNDEWFALVYFWNLLFFVLSGFLVLGLVVTFIGLLRKAKYIDMELLPVCNNGSSKRKKIESNDGWEDNWNDDWDDDDDEEAPKNTSFLALSSTFSQDVISSRRINKDGWKD